MHRQLPLALICACFCGPASFAADLSAVDRSIAKEPVYASKTPRYGLLVFGADASQRVWLVHDGDTLYVDRNGNGDLAEPGEKVRHTEDKLRDPAEFGYQFEVGELKLGGKVHKGLTVGMIPLDRLAAGPDFADVAAVQAQRKATPNGFASSVSLEVESNLLKGGRRSFQAGFYDAGGFLVFSDRRSTAPIIHPDGPLQATLFGRPPVLRVGRESDLVLVVGAPGHGPGTLAMLSHDIVPDDVHPRVEIVYPPLGTDPPLKEHYELKQRC